MNEKRFESFEIGQIYSKTKRLPNVSLDRMGRDKSIFKTQQLGLEYRPKFELVMPRMDLGSVDFEKILPRKTEYHPKYTMNEKSYFKMDSYKNLKGISFGKMTDRDYSYLKSNIGRSLNSVFEFNLVKNEWN